MARRSAIAAVLALAIACAACTAGSAGGSPPGPASAGDAGPGVITVGSFDTAVAFEPRADTVRHVRRTEGLALCGLGAACQSGPGQLCRLPATASRLSVGAGYWHGCCEVGWGAAR